MGRSFLRRAALLTTGVALGLALGAWWWKAGSAGSARDRVMSDAAPRPPAGGPRKAGAAESERADVKADRTARLAALAARFRAAKESRELREEAMLQQVGAVVGLAGLTSGDFAELMSLMSEPRLDAETALVPLIRWASVDPKAALAFALSQDEFKSSERVIAVIVHEMARADLPAAKAALDHMEGEERTTSQRAIVRLLQQSDPAAALAYARELNDSEAERNVLVHWAKSDPRAAAAELTTGKPDQVAAVEAIAGAWANEDRPAFEAWAAGLTDPVGRAVARRAGLALDALTDPAKAAAETAAWLAAEPHAQTSAGDLPVHVAQRWWQKAAPQDVAAWAASLTAGKAKNAALGEVARLWVDEDPRAASGWLGALPPGDGRDQGVRQLVWKVSKQAPDEAFEWARSITGSGLRDQMLAESVRAWAHSDPVAAQAAVSTLPPEERGNLIELIEKERAGDKQR
jgi:hypothetical protein